MLSQDQALILPYILTISLTPWAYLQQSKQHIQEVHEGTIKMKDNKASDSLVSGVLTQVFYVCVQKDIHSWKCCATVKRHPK